VALFLSFFVYGTTFHKWELRNWPTGAREMFALDVFDADVQTSMYMLEG
jgi:hypothetical protein